MRISHGARRLPSSWLLGVPCALAVAIPGAVCAQHADAEDEVVVTGVPRERSPGELAQPVTVLGGDALDRARAGSLGETLADQLGVSSSYFGSGASRPIIRGLAGARVRTLEDGIDSMDAATVSDDHAVSVEPLVADQIEIFRGPTTLLYGSGAVGGVINTVTTRIPRAVPEDGLAGGFEVRTDSVSDGRAAAVRLDGGRGQLAWHFDAHDRESDDYEIPGLADEHAAEEEPGAEGHAAGVLENSAVEARGAALGASWLGERAFLGAAVSTFDTLYGVPGHHHHREEHHEEGDGAEPEAEEAVRIDLEQTRVDLRGGVSGLGGAIEAVHVRVGLNDYEHVELEGEAVGTRFSNDAAEARVELLHAPFGAWRGAFGVQLGERDFAAIGAEAFVPPVRTRSYGVFLVEDLELPAWQLSFGGRLDTQEHVPSGGRPPVDDRAASVSFAALRDLARGYSLAFNVAAAERLPVAEELYSDGPHLATGAIQIGDPALGAETSTHLDVGIRKEEGTLTWSVAAFVTDYDAFIYLADTGVVDALEELPVLAFVQHDAELAGLEAELFAPVASPGRGEIDLRLFADYVRGRLRDGGGDLPRMPPLRYGARLQYHDERVVVGLEAARHDEQDRVAAFETPTEGYTMVNADFRWRIETSGGARLDVFVNANNLTDEEARRHTSLVKDVAPLPGRNYVLGVRSRF